MEKYGYVRVSTREQNLERQAEGIAIGLSCSDNSLTELDVSQNLELTYLDCEENGLTELDLNHNQKLSYLNCDDNVDVIGYK